MEGRDMVKERKARGKREREGGLRGGGELRFLLIANISFVQQIFPDFYSSPSVDKFKFFNI
jgi:hypothetical protein